MSQQHVILGLGGRSPSDLEEPAHLSVRTAPATFCDVGCNRGRRTPHLTRQAEELLSRKSARCVVYRKCELVGFSPNLQSLNPFTGPPSLSFVIARRSLLTARR